MPKTLAMGLNVLSNSLRNLQNSNAFGQLIPHQNPIIMNGKRKILSTCVVLLVSSWMSLHAQLVTTGSGTVSANALVNNIIGSGITFSNASYTGKPVAVGTFNGASSNIGLNSGVIITTGHINVAPGPNDNGGATYSNNGPSIPELQQLAQSNTLDGAILEFDFVPQSDFVSFRYVFASEEYNEYVCSEFNDAFAFFITGPGITGAENLALVPSTTTPVTINTINNGSVGALGSITNSPCILGNSAYFVGNTQNTVQYDGWTTVLTASRTVVPCQTYHIKLMIADGADDIFDSAVFLEENSFNAETFTVSVSTFYNDSTVYEGCTDATVTVSRPDADPTPLTISYTVGGTATPGVDYAALPGTVTIPANQSSVTFSIEGYADGITEGTETIIINANTACGVIPQVIFLEEKPPVSIYAPDVSICNGQGPVVVNATPSGGVQPYSYSWNTGETSSSISVNPASTTVYTVTITDFCGTTSQAQPIVDIANAPTASISAPPFVCSGVPVTVAYTGTASPAATYIWDFDSPSSVNSGSSQGPYQVSWDSSGVKIITLQVIANGCSSNVVSTQVLVNPTPTADFVVDPVVCAGQTTNITYTGTGTDGGGYGWGFPGGVIITGGRRGPFEIRWDSVGVYGVTLTVTENGCESPGNEVFVNVQPTPTSDFTAETPVCVGEPSTISYNGTASSTATYNWNFAGGMIASGSGPGPYEIVWNTPGTKDVFLSVTEAGCSSNITTQQVIVNNIPTANFTVASPVCAGQPTTVTYTGSANNNAQYDWNFGSATVISGAGQGPYTISWPNPGTYPVSLSVTRNGCTSSPFIESVVVNAIPTAPFTVETPVCVGEGAAIAFSGVVQQGAVFNWDFTGGEILSGLGAGPFEVYWQTPGTKQVTLSVTSPQGCPSPPTTQPIVVNPTPTSIFNAETPICLNESSTVTYTGSGNPSAQYTWNFNGGNILSGSGQGPFEIQWGTPGIKTLTVQVEENGCISPPTTQQVNVLPLPTGFFTVVSPVCAFSTTSITYSGNASPGAFFSWDFDNGIIVSGSGPGPIQVYWESPGPKSIRLVVEENGCSSYEEVNIVNVNPIPTNSFSATSPVCIGEASIVNYTGNALSNANFVWDFGEGTVLSGAGDGPFEVVWDSPGQKEITLNLSQFGCPGPEAVQTVQVNPIPTSPFIADERVCVGASATITYTGTAGPLANYNWNFNGGVIVSGSGQGPFQVYWNTPGIKTITMSVVENGCPSTPSTAQVEVIPYPTSDFTAVPLACQGYSTTVTYTGTSLPEAIFDWSFAGGEIVSGSGAGPYQISWETIGDKILTLTVNQYGCESDPSEVVLNVAPTPEALAGDDQLVCPGDEVQLGSPTVDIYEYSWTPAANLDNPTIGNPIAVLENFSNEIEVTTFIVATTLGNCTAYDTVDVSVQPLPQAWFDSPVGQCLQGNSFDFNLGGNFSENAQFDWNFGQFANPTASNIQSPQDVAFGTVGTHIITLQLQDWGCASPVYTDSVVIYPMPLARFEADDVEGCPPLNVTFTNLSSEFGNPQYNWDMGDGFQMEGFIPVHAYNESGNYSVTITVTTEQGCSSEYTAHSAVTVYPKPDAGFKVNPQVLTTAHPLANIIDQSSGAISWVYTLGDGTNSYERNFTHNYFEPGEYALSQRVTNQFGCQDVAIYQLKVEPVMTFFIPNAFTPNEDGTNEIYKCEGLNIEDFRMEIYTRWGELVFESNDIDYGWNGRKFNDPNRPMSQMDVYAVVVYVRDNSDLPMRRIDHRVTLVR
jgi:gliding motility-associated-like protein